MARIVRHERTGPIKIGPQDKPVWVCGCGLSANFPFCDGAHKACAGEKPGMIYRYDPATRRVIEESPEDGGEAGSAGGGPGAG